MTFAKQGIASDESAITFTHDGKFGESIKLMKPEKGITEIIEESD